MRVAALAVALWFLVSPARAEETCGKLRPFVELSFEGRSFTADFIAAFIGDLSAGLREQGVEACLAAPSGRNPEASVFVRSRATNPTRVTIEVIDGRDGKRFERVVDLERLPKDGRAFALAVATDELLRASWVELERSRAEQPSSSPPSESAPTLVEPDPKPRRTERASAETIGLGARLATEHFTLGQTHFGLDGVLRLPITRPFGLELSLGGRKALDERAPHGTVGASAFGGALLGFVTLHERPSFSVDFGLGMRAFWIAFDASAESGAVADDQGRWALTSRAALGVRGGGRVRASLTGGAGVPLLAVKASEGSEVITGVAGLELFLATGVEVRF